MIWEYNDSAEQIPDEVAKSFHISIHGLGFGRHGICPFCAEKLHVLPQNKKSRRHMATHPRKRKRPPERILDCLTVEVCPVCGWWHVLRRHETSMHMNADVQTFFARIGTVSGVLKQFDIADISAPTETLINYLVVKYPTRFEIHPRKLEEIVGAIFSDAGYRVRVTSYSADGGIDVIILDGPDDQQVGIEVKRWNGKIEAQQIRALAGALLEKGIPRGVFVTTSSFTEGARTTAKNLFERGYPIELVNGDTLYECLRLHRRAKYSDALDPTAPFYRFIKDPQSVPLDESNREQIEAKLRQDLMQGLLNWIPREHAAEGEQMVRQLWESLWK